MYKNGDVNSKKYKFGTECLDEFRKAVRDDDRSVEFIWKDKDAREEDKALIINYLCKFQLLQDLRANGLHAGIGCSRDVVVSTANDIYNYIQLLAKGKRLKAYLKNIPAPEATIRDREIIIEDLQRRLNGEKTLQDKTDILRGMYIVLPYIPDIKPDWVDCFEKISAVPPTQGDVSYLLKTLQEAHSIYLLKSRGGKEGVPVRVENDNPEALPIAIQNIKRTLNNIPDMFNNDVLTANTWIDQGRLSLPIDDFLVDLFALGVKRSKVLQVNSKFTAQQAWPFVVSAYSTQGTPRPCWEFIRNCDEIDKLINYLERAKAIGNGYYTRRADSVIKSIKSYNLGTPLSLSHEKDKVFKAIKEYATEIETKLKVNPLTPQFIRNNPMSEQVSSVASDYVSGDIGAGDAVEKMLTLKDLNANDKRTVGALMRMCNSIDQRNGLVAVLRSESMKNIHSVARKQMFLVDYLNNGLEFI